MTTPEQPTPPRTRCEMAARALYDYLDGRLAPDASATVQAHVETCRVCAPHFDFARELLALLPASMPLTDVPPELRARLLATLRAEGLVSDS